MQDQERRRNHGLSEDQIEEIAERAAEKAVQKITQDVYQQVGKGVVSKLLWFIGASVVGFALWLQNQGVGLK